MVFSFKLKANDNNFNANDFKYLQFLEEDNELESILIELRSVVPLPKNGFESTNSGVKNLSQLTSNQLINLWSSARIFTFAYQLPPRWMSTTLSLLLFNIATPPDEAFVKRIDFEFFNHRNALKANKFPEVRILIRERISVDSLIKLIEKNRLKLDKLLSYLPKNPDVNKIKIVNRAKEIKRLSEENKGITDEEVASQLEKKFPEIFDTYESVRKIRSRFETYLRKHIKRLSPASLGDLLSHSKGQHI